MLHVILISAVVIVLVRGGFDRPPMMGLWGPWGTGAVVIGGMAGAWLLAHLWVRRQTRILDTTGRVAAAESAERAVLVSRFVMLAIFGFGVLALGWLDAVRAGLGDLVAVDEWAALAPLMVLIALGWWSYYPVDALMRDAVIQRKLDEGEPFYTMQTRGQWVWSNVRHQMGLILAPVLVIMAWSEFVQRATDRLTTPGGAGVLHSAALRGAGATVQIAGVVVIFALMPVILRRVWDTIPLGPGPILDRLKALCVAQRVRVSEFLVWRTHGTMVNGAVMGLIGPLRYVLLTDALLDSLTEPQVEAVAAHEVGHVRRKHMIWLAVATLTAVAGSAIALGRVAEMVLGDRLSDSATAGWAAAVVTVLSLTAGMLAFGFTSRRFEWQADAFAVQHMSGARAVRAGEGGGPVVSREAVDAMVGALDAVARLNQIPLRRFSWRHGSIATRRRKLESLVGRKTDGLAVDSAAMLLKLASAFGAACVAVFAILEVARDAGLGAG